LDALGDFRDWSFLGAAARVRLRVAVVLRTRGLLVAAAFAVARLAGRRVCTLRRSRVFSRREIDVLSCLISARTHFFRASVDDPASLAFAFCFFAMDASF
jgi:hypothetical protein